MEDYELKTILERNKPKFNNNDPDINHLIFLPANEIFGLNLIKVGIVKFVNLLVTNSNIK